jgi:hypothetical protein
MGDGQFASGKLCQLGADRPRRQSGGLSVNRHSCQCLSVKISEVSLTPALVQVINRRVVQGVMISRLEMLLLIPATVRFGASLRCTLLAAGLPEAVEV